jgi:tRNA pseudouridine13 synthase
VTPTTDWPRAHGEPVAAAHLRLQATDFVVIEELGFEPSGDGEHDFLTLEKTGTNTLWLARQLSRHAGVPVGDVGYCGLKDRHAVTTQHFTVRRPNRDGTDWAAFNAEGVRIIDSHRHNRKLRHGAHTGNRFRILARGDGLGRHAEALHERWAAVAALGVPNYFGDQRFGRDGGNLELARSVLGGRRVPREQRSFALSAARSYLFNRILAARVQGGTWNSLLPGERVNLDGSGSVFTAEDIDAELTARCKAFDLHPSGSLWGDGAPLATGEAAVIERSALAGEEALTGGLERARLEAGSRPLRVRPSDTLLTVGKDAACFAFSLPAGSFATSVLREVLRDA